MLLRLSIILLLSSSVLNLANCASTTTREENATTTYDYEVILRKNLLRKYNIHMLPKHNATSPIKVYIKLSLVSIPELNERSERLTVETFVKLVWNDSRLSWKPEDYGSITTVRFPDHQIWQPDIKLFNSAKASEFDPWGNVYTQVQSSGQVQWVPPATFHSICNVDLKFYPYDVQLCTLRFASWTLDGHHVDIELLDNFTKIELSRAYNENNEWEIIESGASKRTQYFRCCEEPYPEVIYQLRLRRRAPYYKFTTLYPTLAVVMLTLATFWLPPTATERITIGCVNIIVLVVILVHLSWKLPPTGRTIPTIVWFCGNVVILASLSIVLSMVNIAVGRPPHTRASPRLLKYILDSWFGRIFCLNAPLKVTLNKNGEPTCLEFDDVFVGRTVINKEVYFVMDWKQSLQMLDRIYFLVFLITFVWILGASFNQ